MSIQFSDTTNNNGLIQRIEFKLFGDNGNTKISGNTTLLQKITSDCNVALDRAFSLIFNADGKWQFDDSNHTDYPIITTDLVANQRDYSFTTDENSNLILQIHKVLVDGNNTGKYYEITEVDQQSGKNLEDFWDGQNNTGTPSLYDKTANAIFLDRPVAANVTNGLKIYISREGNYFTTADTTQKPGFAGLFHEYIVYHVCFNYAVDNSLQGARGYQERMLDMEREMVDYYSRRSKDERPTFKPETLVYE